jgi:hypothetical protein
MEDKEIYISGHGRLAMVTAPLPVMSFRFA